MAVSFQPLPWPRMPPCVQHALTCLHNPWPQDYVPFYERHRQNGADITIGCLPVDEEAAKGFGLMKVDEEGRCADLPAAVLLPQLPCCCC